MRCRNFEEHKVQKCKCIGFHDSIYESFMQVVSDFGTLSACLQSFGQTSVCGLMGLDEICWAREEAVYSRIMRGGEGVPLVLIHPVSIRATKLLISIPDPLSSCAGPPSIDALNQITNGRSLSGYWLELGSNFLPFGSNSTVESCAIGPCHPAHDQLRIISLQRVVRQA
jgi:hypothetical protein